MTNPLLPYILLAGLLLVGASGGVGYYYGGKNADARAELKMGEHLALDRKAEADNTTAILAKERELTKALTDVGDAYEKGKKDAEQTARDVTAGLRNGTVQLHSRWASCETQRLADGTAASIELAAAKRDREESIGRIIGYARDADNKEAALRAAYNQMRERLQPAVSQLE